jgi:hypothetical protein
VIEHITALVSSLAWPVTVLTVVLLFRSEFRGAAGRLKALAYKDFRAEFERDLQILEGNVKELPSEKVPLQVEKQEAKLSLTDESLLIRLTEISPRAAIMEAWRNIEVTTKQVAQAYGIALSGNIAGVKAIHEIVNKGLLPEQVIPIYERLRRIRARAAHNEDFAIEQNEAEKYIEMAHQFYVSLQFLLNQLEQQR